MCRPIGWDLLAGTHGLEPMGTPGIIPVGWDPRGLLGRDLRTGTRGLGPVGWNPWTVIHGLDLWARNVTFKTIQIIYD